MTPDERAAARARCEAAKKGPWKWTGYLRGKGCGKRIGLWQDESIEDSDLILDCLHPDFLEAVPGMDCHKAIRAWMRGIVDDNFWRDIDDWDPLPNIADDSHCPDKSNAEFIAHARADLPAALDLIDSLEAELAQVVKERDDLRRREYERTELELAR